MLLCAQRRTFALLQRLGQAQTTIQLVTQYLSINEEPNYPLSFRPVTIGDRYPNPDIFLPRIAI